MVELEQVEESIVNIEGGSSDDGALTPRTNTGSTDSAVIDYDIRDNWSLILTDDNNSTDHDFNSNYCSSIDGSDRADVSESESNVTASLSFNTQNERTGPSSPLHAIKSEKSEGNLWQANSISTLKQSAGESFLLPDPLASSPEHHIVSSPGHDRASSPEHHKSITPESPSIANSTPEKPTKVKNDISIKPFFNSLKMLMVYFILAALALDKSLQLIDSYYSKAAVPVQRAAIEHSNGPLSWTFIHYITDEDDENPKVARLSVANGEPSTWDLISELCGRGVSGVKSQYNDALQANRKLLKKAKDVSVKAIDNTKKVDWGFYLKGALNGANDMYERIKYEFLSMKKQDKAKRLSENFWRASSTVTRFLEEINHSLAKSLANRKTSNYGESVVDFIKRLSQSFSNFFKNNKRTKKSQGTMNGYIELMHHEGQVIVMNSLNCARRGAAHLWDSYFPH